MVRGNGGRHECRPYDWSVWLGVLVACAGCFHGAPSRPPTPPPIIAEVSGFAIHAENSGVISTATPVSVQVTVTLTNTTKRDTTLTVLGGNCEVLLQIYTNAKRTGHPVLDTSNPGVECFGDPLTPQVFAGGTLHMHSPRDGPSSPLPPRRYWITALVTFVTPRGARRLPVPAGDFVVPAE